MPDGFTIAALSMTNDMQRLSSISQNLTNALTPGYKREIPLTAAFASMVSGNGAFSADLPSASGQIDMKQSALRHTGNPLDLAIENNGFFEIIRDGKAYYTRQGNFTLDPTGRLVTQSGDIVNGVSGDIRLTTSQPTIDSQGNVIENGKPIGQLKIVHFEDPRMLQAVGEGKFLQAGAAIKAEEKIALRQSHLETSNVNTAAEMVKMIETMRHFETGQKIIQMYDAMNERAISKLGEF
ncbi:flagellar basal-body rod protein FlgG [Paucimonas lemoignei]|uniref:Flagellar basal-body rod protein FlgG n=1 Tax=Paucimonas lemoignei TaxID=29443 RepID=A0A4R3HYF9_PAULE|nr:flagellar hook-basal body protein [Paucimonas lemoignei]TCS37713.1 flagellar basal-body rod protein FlgG [Paucimonas lemoignei]